MKEDKMLTGKKTAMTNEEVLERLKEILKANGWKDADLLIEAVFHDHIIPYEDSYHFVQGFLSAMVFGGILDKEERYFLIDSLIENGFPDRKCFVGY